MLDEFVLSARAKWGQEPSLVMLLPHGYEGQGPDHASARPERFLQLAADINMRVANCTTAAQYFHLLRRQAALLEDRSAAARRAHAEEPAASSAGGVARRAIWPRAAGCRSSTMRTPRRAPKDVRRLVLCTGKVAVDLLTSPHRSETPARRDLPRRAAVSAARARHARA